MSRPPHILALVTEAWGFPYGIAQYNRDLFGALIGAGGVGPITVMPRLVVSRADPPPGVEQMPARHGRVVYGLGALLASLSRPVDIVFCGHLYMAPLGLALARLKGARLVIQLHGVEAWAEPTAAQRAAVEAADLVLAVSRYTRAAVLDWAAVAPERVIVIPNTVGDDFVVGDDHGLRNTWGLEGKRILLTVGRMAAREAYKGHDRVISALPSLDADVIYVIVGDGDDGPRLQALAREAGVADRVRFMGAQPDDVRLAAYRMADLFVMPSTGEGFGIVFLEAMACGTPALGFGVAGARDALADGDLGVMADEDGLAAAIAEALTGTRRRGEALAGAVRAKFGREAFEATAHGVVRRLVEAA